MYLNSKLLYLNSKLLYLSSTLSTVLEYYTTVPKCTGSICIDPCTRECTSVPNTSKLPTVTNLYKQ